MKASISVLLAQLLLCVPPARARRIAHVDISNLLQTSVSTARHGSEKEVTKQQDEKKKTSVEQPVGAGLLSESVPKDEYEAEISENKYAEQPTVSGTQVSESVTKHAEMEEDENEYEAEISENTALLEAQQEALLQEEQDPIRGGPLLEIDCSDYMSTTGCWWTKKWNCAGQPAGTEHPAGNDNSIGYNCCCLQGMWRGEQPVSGDSLLQSEQPVSGISGISISGYNPLEEGLLQAEQPVSGDSLLQSEQPVSGISGISISGYNPLEEGLLQAEQPVSGDSLLQTEQPVSGGFSQGTAASKTRQDLSEEDPDDSDDSDDTVVSDSDRDGTSSGKTQPPVNNVGLVGH